MIDSISFLYIVYIFSIAIHAIALYIAIAFVVPLEIKEARVRNGLAKLRILMLLAGITIIFLSIISIITLTLRFFVSGDIARYLTVALVFFHSLGFLMFAVIKRTMYKEQYTEKQKELHEKMADIEDNEAIRKS